MNEIPINEILPDKYQEIVILIHGFGGNKDVFSKLQENFFKENIGSISFDLPYHGENKREYSVINCLKTIEKIYNYTKAKNNKIDFIGISLGSLYLYYFLQNKKFDKAIFLSFILNNKEKMINNFQIDKDYIYLKYHRKISTNFLDDIDNLEKNIKKLKGNILFIHGQKDKLSNINDIKEFCEKYYYPIEVLNTDHNIKDNKLNEILIRRIKC